MAYKIEDFAMMAPMRYYNNEAASQKRTDMIEDKDDLYVASEKHDGNWSMFIHYSKGNLQEYMEIILTKFRISARKWTPGPTTPLCWENCALKNTALMQTLSAQF